MMYQPLVLLGLLDCAFMLIQPTMSQSLSMEVPEVAVYTAEGLLDALSWTGGRRIKVYENLYVQGPVVVNADGTDQQRLLSILVRPSCVPQAPM